MSVDAIRDSDYIPSLFRHDDHGGEQWSDPGIQANMATIKSQRGGLSFGKQWSALKGDRLYADGTIPEAAFSEQNIQNLPAMLTRAQWDDYITRFVPYEDALLNQTHYNNPGIVQQEIDAAMPHVEGAINIGQQTMARRLKALGQHVSTEAQQRIDQDWDMQRTLARTDAANRIRQNIAARSRDIAFGGTGGTQSAINMNGGG